jgi:hypothetical protein
LYSVFVHEYETLRQLKKDDIKHAHLFNGHLPLLDADIDVANDPCGKEERYQASEEGKRLAQGIHQRVVIGHLDLVSNVLQSKISWIETYHQLRIACFIRQTVDLQGQRGPAEGVHIGLE